MEPCLLAAGGYITEVVDVPGKLEPNTSILARLMVVAISLPVVKTEIIRIQPICNLCTFYSEEEGFLKPFIG